MATEAVTVEQAQLNLLRKRKEQGIPETKIPALQEVITRVTESLPSRAICSKHGDEYPCQKCREEMDRIIEKEEQKRIEEEAKKKRDREERPEEILKACGIGKQYLSCSFDTFQGGNGIKAIMQEYVKNPGTIVLHGSTGSGKTHLAVSVLREFVKKFKANNRYDAIFITAPELLLKIRGVFGSNNGVDCEEDLVDKYSTVPFLILDDIGAEKSTEWSITTLYLIIDRRNREMLPTIYTTNLSGTEIEAHLGQRIGSRLADAKNITIQMPDYRKKRG